MGCGAQKNVVIISGQYDVAALAFFSAAGITIDTQKNAVNYLVTQLKGAGLWSKFTALYPIVGGNATAHSYNLKDTARFKITWVNSPTHSSTGVLYNGTTQYGDTGINAATYLTINSTAISAYSRTTGAAAATRVTYGLGDAGANRLQMYIRQTGDLLLFDSYDNLNGRVNASNTTTHGLFTGSRTSTTSSTAYRNSASIGSIATRKYRNHWRSAC
jgi:hypothetical protein